MSTCSLAHLSDGTLARDLAALVARDRVTTAALLAHIAEFDSRKLHLTAGQPSMYSYCVKKLHLSEEAAYKRIHAARAARRFPAIFAAVADGRLHLSAVILLAPYLTTENATDLLAAAAHRTKAEIELLLARRFPRPDLPTRLKPIPVPGSVLASQPYAPATPGAPPHGPVIEHAPGRVPEPHQAEGQTGEPPSGNRPTVVDAQAAEQAPGRVDVPGPRPRVMPLAPERFALQMTIGGETHRKLQRAQALLGHVLPANDLAALLDRALDALIGQLEQQKFGGSTGPRPGARARRPSHPDSRHIPAEVRRAVWKRDGGRCTYVSDDGTRCPARSRLEFDHMDAYARGGSATVSGTRLLCRAHNQHEAQRTYGAEFMRHKRLAAAERRAAARKPAVAAEQRAEAAEHQAVAARSGP